MGTEDRSRRFLLAILAVALILRLVHWWAVRDEPFFAQLAMDSQEYDRWAQEIAAGDWLGTRVFFQAPLYPYLLGTVYALAARSLDAIYLLQVAVASGEFNEDGYLDCPVDEILATVNDVVRASAEERGMDADDAADEIAGIGAAIGASYGGFMSSWTIGHTDRFKAAVIGAPVVDLAIAAVVAPIHAPNHLFRKSPVLATAAWHNNSPSLHSTKPKLICSTWC